MSTLPNIAPSGEMTEVSELVPHKIYQPEDLFKSSFPKDYVLGTMSLGRHGLIDGVLIYGSPLIKYFVHNTSKASGSGPGTKIIDGVRYEYGWEITPQSWDCKNFTAKKIIKNPTIQSSPKPIKNPFTKAISLNDHGYLFLRSSLLEHKNGDTFAIQPIPTVIKLIETKTKDLQLRFKVQPTTRTIYDIFTSDGAEHPYHTFSWNLALSRQGPIGDCGFGALAGVDATNPDSTDPIIQNFRMLSFFTFIEIGLSNCGYLISSVRISDSYKNISIRKHLMYIAKHSGCAVPIMNPHMEDHQLENPYDRERYFTLITHAGLKKYYQSDEFKALNLQC